MGRNSGGVNSSSRGSSANGVSKGATEKGYTKKMVKNILSVEQKYRNNKDETAHFFNEKGDLVTSVAGKGAQVKFDTKIVPANSIITHNHPRSIGAEGIYRIGNSFSTADVATAVDVNAKEIRAVTPTYTFSLKRPKGGWGVTAKEVEKTINAISDDVFDQNMKYISKTRTSEAQDRATVAHSHQVMKRVAKKYGWDYTKKHN